MKPTRIPDYTALAQILVLMACGALSPIQSLASLTVENLRCEYRVDPVGMDVTQPRLSWTLASEERGQRQIAYEILVASSPESLARNEGDLWSPGRVDSDQTIQLAYAGKPLQSRMRVWWKVRVWDQDGKPSPWSDA